MILAELRAELEQLASRGRKREWYPASRGDSASVEYRGKVLTDFASWDYLGVGSHKSIIKAVRQAVDTHGLGPAAPRLSSGTTPLHLLAERRLSEFLGYETALYLPSRTQCVLAWITSLANERDIFIVDELLQSPVSDAAFLVGATVETFKDTQTLTTALERSKLFRRRFLVVETLSPLTGLSPSLEHLSLLARKHDALLILDETYALGALGVRGAGGAELFAQRTNELLLNSIFLSYADLSVGLGVTGGVIASQKSVFEYIVNASRALANDTSPSVPLVASVPPAIEIVELSPIERERAGGLALRLKKMILTNALITPRELPYPILCMRFAKVREAFEVQRGLFEKGFLVDVAPLGIPLNDSGIVRIVVRVVHTDHQIETLAQGINDVLERYNKKK